MSPTLQCYEVHSLCVRYLLMLFRINKQTISSPHHITHFPTLPSLISCSFVSLQGTFLHLLQGYIPMANEVMVDDIAFAPEFTLTKTLPLLGYGCTELEIHFLQIKHTAIGVYIDPAVVDHLQKWKGKSGKDLVDNDEFFEAVATAPVEVVIKVVVIKEIKASQYGTQLEGAVRDRLAAVDMYEDEEEAALENVAQFFPTKYLKKNSYFTFKFFASGQAEITMTIEEKEDTKTKVENVNVAETIKKWYLGGSRAVSPTTIQCLANNLSAHLSE